MIRNCLETLVIKYFIKFYFIAQCYVTAYNRIKNDPNHILVVMEYNQEIIGTLQFILIQTLTLQGCLRAEIEGVRIKSNYRSFGLGKILFDWVKKTATIHGCGLIQLTTNNTRIEAQKFYSSIGFTNSHTGMKMMLK
jgi:GNAT superfamily N-acetyltransferase